MDKTDDQTPEPSSEERPFPPGWTVERFKRLAYESAHDPMENNLLNVLDLLSLSGRMGAAINRKGECSGERDAVVEGDVLFRWHIAADCGGAAAGITMLVNAVKRIVHHASGRDAHDIWFGIAYLEAAAGRLNELSERADAAIPPDWEPDDDEPQIARNQGDGTKTH